MFAVSLGVNSQIEFTVRRLTIGDCPRPDASTISGLITDSFNLADRTEAPGVTVLDTTIVCESPGLLRDTISSFSVVALYSCTGIVAEGCDGSNRTEQFQYECNMDNTFTEAEISSGFLRTENPTATLQTPLNDQCAQCVEPTSIVPSDPDDHCIGKLVSCQFGALKLCLGFKTQGTA